VSIERILFFASRKSDYLEEIVLAGLHGLNLGDRLVLCPPPLKCYFSRKPYPRSIGKCRQVLSYIPDVLKAPGFYNSFDCVILGSLKRDVFENYLRVRDRLPPRLPVVLIDGGDWADVGGDSERLGFGQLYRQAANARPFDIIFKRERMPSRSFPSNVFPLPMAFVSTHAIVPASTKKYDVVFWGVESHPARAIALDMLQSRFDCAANGTVRHQKPRIYPRKGSRYLKELASARVCCNFRGAGWDTLRYWEIPAVGSFMISQAPAITIPDNFVSEVDCVFCKEDLGDLLDRASYYLRNEKEREEIAANGRKRLYAYHTHIHRAQYILDILNQRL
jgi:hypothetical protein